MDLGKLTAQAEQLRSATMAASRGPGRAWYRMTNQGPTTKIYVYDMIGEYGITAQNFVADLMSVTTPAIDLHVNSEGGQVFDGVAIYAALKSHPADVTAYVDALAASAASFIVQAADTRVMRANARMMIHEAQGVAVGNAEDVLSLAALLEDTSANIASIYAERSGVPVEEWRTAMRAETWYGAQEAVDAGLADLVDGQQPSTPKNLATAQPVASIAPAGAAPAVLDLVSIIKESAV